MAKVFGKSGWNLSPVYFYKPGLGTISETYAVPIHFDEEVCRFRINSPHVITVLAEYEARRPGSMKKGLSWLAPFSEPPCWHQIQKVEMKVVRHGVEVTLKLGETPCQQNIQSSALAVEDQ
jgi:hypothetical protein